MWLELFQVVEVVLHELLGDSANFGRVILCSRSLVRVRCYWLRESRGLRAALIDYEYGDLCDHYHQADWEVHFERDEEERAQNEWEQLTYWSRFEFTSRNPEASDLDES